MGFLIFNKLQFFLPTKAQFDTSMNLYYLVIVAPEVLFALFFLKIDTIRFHYFYM